MRKANFERIKSWGPCDKYSDNDYEHLRELIGDKEVTALEVLDSDIPDADKIWLIVRPYFMRRRGVLYFAANCAEQCLANYTAVYADASPLQNAIDATRARANALTKEEISAASSAASSAADAASRAASRAAYSAAYSAADAAYSAAYSAADAASRAASRAAYSAAYSAASSAASRAQIEFLRAILLDGGAR